MKLQIVDNNCKECNHAPHEAGECKQCNCGQSEVIHPRGESFLVPRNDGSGQMKGGGGRRAYRDGTVD